LAFAGDGAYTHHAIREYLGTDWRGGGPVIVLDAAAIRAEAAADTPECFARCVRNVFVHELAHRATHLCPAATINGRP
jgi:hypothetical protein